MTGKDAEKIIDGGLTGVLLLPAARIILAKWRNEKLEHERTKIKLKRIKEGRQ